MEGCRKTAGRRRTRGSISVTFKQSGPRTAVVSRLEVYKQASRAADRALTVNQRDVRFKIGDVRFNVSALPHLQAMCNHGETVPTLSKMMDNKGKKKAAWKTNRQSNGQIHNSSNKQQIRRKQKERNSEIFFSFLWFFSSRYHACLRGRVTQKQFLNVIKNRDN